MNGIKEIKSFVTVFDPNDTTLLDMTLKGVNVGQYRNDIFSKWNMTLDIDTVIADYELYFCHRLSDELNIDIKSPEDVLAAQKLLLTTKGMSIASWAEKLMDRETDKELLKGFLNE